MPPPIPLEPLPELLAQRVEEIMDWVPIAFMTFKVLVLGTLIFFCIKSHRDNEKKEQEEERRRQNRTNGS